MTFIGVLVSVYSWKLHSGLMYTSKYIYICYDVFTFSVFL